MVKVTILILINSLMLLLSSCSPLIDYRQLLERDMQPPAFLGIHVVSPVSVHILFSETISLKQDSLFIIPQPPDFSTAVSDTNLTLNFSENLIKGEAYKIKTTVQDTSGNTMTLISTFYGFNPDLPTMIINEFTTQGSSTNPDRVEIAVLSDGNTAGAVLFEGIDTDWNQRKVFPSLAVTAGDFIVVHFKSTGDPGEIDETESKTASSGVKAADNAWDLWVDGGTGLSGNNGTIVLFTALYGTLIDGVLYSNRTSESDENYRGFGSIHVRDRADRLVELSGWDTAGECIAPEDSINPEDSTATRSMCRGSDSSDSSTKNDWHIVPTSTSSFGQVNSDTVYTP